MLHALIISAITLFTTSPYQNGSIGLKIELPIGSIVSMTSKSPPFCMITSNPLNPRWHLRLERGAHPDAKTAKVLLNNSAQNVSDQSITIENKSLSVGNIKGWLKVEQHIDNTGLKLIVARFALATYGEQFILATIQTDAEEWSKARTTLMNALQSITPIDPLVLVQEKLGGIQAAISLLESLNEEILTPLFGLHEWRRIRKSDQGEDIGYALVQVTEGHIEEVEIRDGQEDLLPNGIIVTVRSRFVPNKATGVVIDSYGRYWMSWDGKEERWSNRVTRWLDQVTSTDSETGIRNRPEIGSPRSRIMVLQQDLTSDIIQVPFKSLAEDPWLPRALVWILGPLLTSSDKNSHFIWMTYENSGGRQRVATRTDTLTSDKDSNWKIETQFDEGEISVWSSFNEKGDLITQLQKNGLVATKTTHDTLQAIWEPRDLW